MKTVKTLRLLLKEIQDPYVQENFYKLKLYLDDLEEKFLSGDGIAGPAGAPGPAGPPGPSTTSVPKLIATFTTDTGTAVGNIVRVSGVSTVTKITNNLAVTIPNGMFGIVTNKPTTTSADVIFVGIQDGYSGLTAGSPLFVSPAGVPTHTPPTTGMVQQIGFAISATELFLNIMQAMRRD